MLASALFLVGCITGYRMGISITVLTLVTVCLVSGALLFYGKRKAIAVALIVLSMLPLGALRFQLSWQKTEPLKDGKNTELSGRIATVPEWNPDAERTVCVLDDISINGESSVSKLRIYLRGEDTALLQNIALGQRISCKAHIWEAQTMRNPGQFSFSDYLRIRGLSGYATADIKDAVFEGQRTSVFDLPLRIRSAVSAYIDRRFPNSAALAKSFLIGDRSELSEEIRSDYSSAGVAHLLAISGMHISVLAGAVSLLLTRLLDRRRAYFITVFLLLFYGFLIGFPASFVRAFIMYAVAGFAHLVGRYSDGLTRLSAAMLVYLIIRPVAILDAGFVLSYGAFAGITLLYHPLASLFHAENIIKARPVHTVRGFLRCSLPRYAVQALLVTISAQLAILPAVISYFGTQPLFSFLSNILIAPLAMVFYAFSIVAALSTLPFLCAVSDAAYSLLTQMTHYFAKLPLSSQRIAAFPAWLILFCVIVAMASSDLCRLRLSVRRFLPLLVIVSALASNLIASIEARGTDLLFMDAGQADCCMLRSDGDVYFIDTGDSYSPAADYLAAKNCAVKAVFLSHLHEDHAGGLNDILDVCTPETIYLPTGCYDSDVDEEVLQILDKAAAQGTELIYLSQGDSVDVGNDIQLRVLAPIEGIEAVSANNQSMVLSLDYGEFRALFPGDAPADSFVEFAEDVDVLKVSHHGANDALSEELLERTSPSVCVISVGYNNYGHPTEKTLELLRYSDTTFYRTDECGMIHCMPQTDGSFTISTYASNGGNL